MYCMKDLHAIHYFLVWVHFATQGRIFCSRFSKSNFLFPIFQFSIASGQPQCQEKLSASQLLFVSGNFLLIGHPTVNYIAKLRRGVRWALNIIIDFLAELDLPQTEILTREIESTSKNTFKKVNKNTNDKKNRQIKRPI